MRVTSAPHHRLLVRASMAGELVLGGAALGVAATSFTEHQILITCATIALAAVSLAVAMRTLFRRPDTGTDRPLNDAGKHAGGEPDGAGSTGGPGSTTRRTAAERGHEIGNALHALEGAATTLAAEAGALPADQVSALGDAMASEVQRLRGLVDRREQRPRPYELMGTLRPLITLHTGQGMRIDLAAPPFAVAYGRAGAVAQIVANLLRNAERHAQGAPVSVTVAAGERTILVTVANEPAVHSAGRRPGLGIGLTTSAALARAEGGSLVTCERRDGGYSATLTVLAGARSPGVDDGPYAVGRRSAPTAARYRQS